MTKLFVWLFFIAVAIVFVSFACLDFNSPLDAWPRRCGLFGTVGMALAMVGVGASVTRK